MRKFAVFRQPNNILVGVEPSTFNVIQLAEDYGSGTYDVAIFEDGKEIRRAHQVVHERLGPPKKTEALPDSALPRA